MKRMLLLASILLLLGACNTRPIYNAENVTVVTGSGSVPSQEDARRVIVKAATSKGWAVKDIDSTHLQVSHTARGHTAQAVVEYSTNSFSITYHDSIRMKYKGTTIHRKYNGWIRNLEERIQQYFAEI